MPRWRSIFIQSDRVWRRLALARTSPASWIAPPNRSSFSVSVVLPASGCEMIANVRRRSIGSAVMTKISLFRRVRRQRRNRGFFLVLAAGAMIARDERVDRRRHEQREQRADEHAERNHRADGNAAFGAGAFGDNQRNH